MCTLSSVGWCTGGQELFKENLQSMHSPRSETGLKREIGAKKGAFKIWLAGQIAPAAVLEKHSQLFQRFFFVLNYYVEVVAIVFGGFFITIIGASMVLKLLRGRNPPNIFQHPHIWVDGNIKYKIVNFATLSPTVHINLCQLLHGDSFFEHRWK